MGTHRNRDKSDRVLSLCHFYIQTKIFYFPCTHRVWFKCAVTVTETQGCRGGLAVAGSAYKAGRTVPTGECLPKLSARNHRHRCFWLLDENLWHLCGEKGYPLKSTDVVWARNIKKLKYHTLELQNNQWSFKKVIWKIILCLFRSQETMHSLPLLPFAVLILVQTNPSQGLFWRPAA